jgi:hypothetical protein
VSLPIDIDRVEAVLLSDGWHHVLHQTFDLGEYEFVHATEAGVSTLYKGGVGFGFTEKDSSGELHRFSAPVSSLLAVRYTRASDEDRRDEVDEDDEAMPVSRLRVLPPS